MLPVAGVKGGGGGGGGGRRGEEREGLGADNVAAGGESLCPEFVGGAEIPERLLTRTGGELDRGIEEGRGEASRQFSIIIIIGFNLNLEDGFEQTIFRQATQSDIHSSQTSRSSLPMQLGAKIAKLH